VELQCESISDGVVSGGGALTRARKTQFQLVVAPSPAPAARAERPQTRSRLSKVPVHGGLVLLVGRPQGSPWRLTLLRRRRTDGGVGC